MEIRTIQNFRKLQNDRLTVQNIGKIVFFGFIRRLLFRKHEFTCKCLRNDYFCNVEVCGCFNLSGHLTASQKWPKVVSETACL